MVLLWTEISKHLDSRTVSKYEQWKSLKINLLDSDAGVPSHNLSYIVDPTLLSDIVYLLTVHNWISHHQCLSLARDYAKWLWGFFQRKCLQFQLRMKWKKRFLAKKNVCISLFYISINHVSVTSFSGSPLKKDNRGQFNKTFTRVIYKCSHVLESENNSYTCKCSFVIGKYSLTLPLS